ncbi:MAG TPA: ribokinase [Terracidiphilus sp.]
MQHGYDRKPIVVVGSINADLVAKVEQIPLSGQTVLSNDFKVYPGGKGANQAVAVARLGYPVFMIGKLGSDAFGPQLLASMKTAGVNVSTVITVDGASGVALIEVSSSGENSIVVAPGANAMLSPEDIDAAVEVIKAAGLVLVQLEIPLETVAHLIAVCARENVPVILDPAPAQSLPPEVLRQISWFTPNETETEFYTGSDAAVRGNFRKQRDALFAQGLQGVVLKQGSQGVYVADRNGLEVSIPAFQVKAVDTTAAGDAFNGAFATALLLGKDPAESARFAAAAAAVSVTRPGAQSSMASREETEAMLA